MYTNAQNMLKGKGPVKPILPKKVREDCRLTPKELEEIKARNPIMPKKREGPK